MTVSRSQPESNVTAPAAAPERSGLRVGPLIRWLHLYGSMLGLAALLFFSVTGITLNHPDWMLGGVRREHEFRGTLPLDWVGPSLSEDRVARLEIAERLRRDHPVRGAVDEFRVDEREIMVAFKGPGYSGDAFIERQTGAYRLGTLSEGWVAVINDLHKGRHTGPGWAWVIDLTAGLLVLVSATGLAFLFLLRRRRISGLAVGLLGIVGLAVAAWWLVP